MEFPTHVRDLWSSDPFVLADPKTGLYYVYSRYFNNFIDTAAADGNKGRFYAVASRDLTHWTEPMVVFEQGDFWANLDYWAPECHIWQGRYYLVSSFRAEGTYRRCQFLVADHPMGPFHPLKQEPLTPKGWQCLDGTLYVDKGGKPWLVFCHEWVQVGDGQIAAIPLSDDLSEAIGEPTILFRGSDAPWRAGMASQDPYDGNVTDGPFLYRMADDSLLMLWSNYCKGGYATAYAKSMSGEIMGPWIQQPEPLYAFDGGHSMLFHTFEGQLMMALHVPNAHDKKHMILFEMEERNGRLFTVNETTGNWYNLMGGAGGKYRYSVPCIEEPHYRLGIGTQKVMDEA